jgi:outer membrane receptor protein involved in Fe transport
MKSPLSRLTAASRLAAFTATAALALLPAAAFAQGSGGALTGRALDEQAGALPGVTITAVETSTGTSRVAVTDATGSFRFPSLYAGSYDVTAELEGFATSKAEGVEINVATTRTIDFEMKVAGVEEIITVNDVAPLVRTEPSGGVVISRETLESLPLNGRQFANLGTLAPGTTLGINPDPTKPGQLVIAMNGGIGRNVNYVIDGGDNMDDTIGGALQNFSVEAVQEFNLQTQQYKAEYGRSSGGVLTVVTKSGTNEWEGALYGYVRDDELNAKKVSEIEKQPYRREQYGASLGGPIVRDKAHFFLNYEETTRDGFVTTDTGGIFPALDGQTSDTPFTDELIFAKATVNLSTKNFLQVRYGFQKNTDKYNALPNATPDNFGTLVNEAFSFLGGLQTQVSDSSFNELNIQYAEFENSITADSTNPTLNFPSGVTSGQNPNTPQTTLQEKRQIRDDFSFTRILGGKSHDFKVGAEYIDEPVLGGDFSAAGTIYNYSGDSLNSPITDITINEGGFFFETPNEQYRFFIQDDWQWSDRLTLNLGFRYDLSDILELDQRSNAIYQVLSTQTTYTEDYLNEFKNGKGGVIEKDDNDYSVRLGFTWDVSGDGQRLLRGGIGRFYDYPYTNATVLFPSGDVVSVAGNVYLHNNPNGIRNANGTFFKPGDPLPPNQLQNPNVGPAPNNIASPTLSTPYSDQISLGYSHQLSPWLGLSVEAISIDFEDIPFRFRANPRVNGGARRFPTLGNFRIWQGDGFAEYDGLNISLKGRATDKFDFQVNYTLSKAEGNILAGADEFRITDAGHQADFAGRGDQSVNPLDPGCDACTGPLNTDARHRFTLAGFYRGPWGLSVSAIYRYRSALPYTENLGRDVNGDGFTIDIAPGQHVNNLRGASFSQFDLRLAKEFTFGDRFKLEVLAEVFNLFNSDNPAGFNGNRNAGAAFGQPTAFAGDGNQLEQRVGQVGLRFSF